jgi:uncharacterized membrane protein YkoI
MSKRLRIGIAAIAVVVLGGAGAAVAGVGGDDDDATEKPITGVALSKASAAALEHTGGGKVTETEAGDEEGAYEVEVTKPGGDQVDVHLNSSFEVIGTEGDDDTKEDE